MQRRRAAKADAHGNEIQGDDAQKPRTLGDGGGLRKERTHEIAGFHLANQGQRQHRYAGRQDSGAQCRADARSIAGAVVLSHDRCGSKRDRGSKQHDRLHDAQASAESGFRRFAEAADDPEDHRRVCEHERILAPCRQADHRQAFPQGNVRLPAAERELDVVFDLEKIDRKQDHADGYRRGARQPRTRNAQRHAREQAGYQDRRQHDVQRQARSLNEHDGPDDAGRAQRRSGGRHDELECQSGQKPA